MRQTQKAARLSVCFFKNSRWYLICMHPVYRSRYLIRLSVSSCAYFCKQYAYLSVSLSDWVNVSVLARVCGDNRMRKMIVLLGPCSPLRLRGGGGSLGCRGQRLCGSGLLASGGVLELPHQTKRSPSSVILLYKAT